MGRPWYGNLAADIRWFDPQPHLLQLQLGGDGFEVLHDGRHVPSSVIPYRAITVRPPRGSASGLDYLASTLGLDRLAALRLLREVPQCVRGEVSWVNIEEGSPVVGLRSLPDPIRLDEGAIHGGTTIVLLEAAIALAQQHSVAEPTLLLIDDFGDYLHPTFTLKLLRILASASQGFQTVVVTHQLLPAEVRQEWTITAIGADDYESLPGGHASARFP